MKPTLTIAIPAFNEERTISQVLSQVLAQRQMEFELDRIIVYSDGSTDRTNELVREYSRKERRIELVEGIERSGKMFRLNQIFAENESDLLLVLDADIGLEGERFIDTLVRSALEHESAVLFSAHQIPLRPDGFVPRLLYASFLMWDHVRLSVPERDHVQCFYGAATLYRGSFASTLHIPDGATEERVYLYVMAKRAGGFRYVDDAVIRYWPPQSMHDFMALSNRSFGTEQPSVCAALGEDIATLHIIDAKYKRQGVLRSMWEQPLYAPLALAMNFMLSRLTTKKPVRSSPLWEIATSTKVPMHTKL